MTASKSKIAQYLEEARASERALVRDLQAQIAMTPRGRMRTLLERHLRETRAHADRIGDRLDELGHDASPVQIVGDLAQTLVGQAVSLGRAPLALLRGAGGEEKVLKNAKDACAAEALEIATYIALERVARALDDERTAQLAASIREDEERMLERLREELPRLADAVVRAEVYGDPSYDLATTGTADAVRDAADEVRETAREAGEGARRATRQARRAPGVTRAEGEVKGAAASEADLPIAGYDDRTANDIVAKLPALSQVDLGKIAAYERRHEGRSTVLDRISALREDEPWPGYDELTVPDVQAALREADDELVEKVGRYERSHKGRTSVIRATERRIATP